MGTINRLIVDKHWCAKCRKCAIVTNNVIEFDETGYPAELTYEGEKLEIVRVGVSRCPIHVLKLV